MPERSSAIVAFGSLIVFHALPSTLTWTLYRLMPEPGSVAPHVTRVFVVEPPTVWPGTRASGATTTGGALSWTTVTRTVAESEARPSLIVYVNVSMPS